MAGDICSLILVTTSPSRSESRDGASIAGERDRDLRRVKQKGLDVPPVFSINLVVKSLWLQGLSHLPETLTSQPQSDEYAIYG
jgi:hypothetical protein